MKLNAEFPEKLSFLFYPSRYKVARGGRGSAKSWSFGRALLIQGVNKQKRILCAREVQNSIKQSVHQLLTDQINLLKLTSHYRVFDSEIRGKNGTLFSFTGLSTLTVDTIKSFEGFDICWVEEGQAISERSWKILIPTIRKEYEDGTQAEIWISYNPELETDPTHQRFTINQPQNCINVEMNWRDNPWFNQTLEDERQHCLEYDPDNYDNIWEGKCKPAVEGAIYFKQIQESEAQGHICNVPYDPMLKVHLVFDLGWDDSLGCACVQRQASEIRLIEYLEASHTGLDEYSAELRTRGYNWGRVWLPHDGFSGRLESNGKSSYDILTALDWDVATRDEITELSIDEGIRQTRLNFRRMYFDKKLCAAVKPTEPRTADFKTTEYNGRLIEAIKRYRRSVNQKTEAVGKPIRSPHAHAADVLRYVSLNADTMSNEAQNQIKIDHLINQGPLIQTQPSGWMGR